MVKIFIFFFLLDSISGKAQTVSLTPPVQPFHDTVPAILLVGHPWKKDGHYTLDKNGFHPYIDSSFSSKVWQMRGYITYNQVVIYLDENKKPLEPGIIVWMAREW